MDEDVEFVSAGARLSGTLSRPDDHSRLPGVVLVGGSGPSDRHNDGLLDAIRAHLVAAGIAVLT